jgi:hypothetical protein
MEAGECGSMDEVLSHFDPSCEWKLATSSKTIRDGLRRLLQGGFAESLTRDKPDVKAEFASDEWIVGEWGRAS